VEGDDVAGGAGRGDGLLLPRRLGGEVEGAAATPVVAGGE
jgi:hypothetical protein